MRLPVSRVHRACGADGRCWSGFHGNVHQRCGNVRLERDGHVGVGFVGKVGEATNGAEALDVVRSAAPQVVWGSCERFIDELNKTVQGVWDDLKPTETQGKKKGQPKALPVFSIHADGLVLSVETWKNPRRVLNPLCTLQHGEIAPFWMHEAWLEAMRRIVDLLDTLTAAPAEALESQ